MRLFSFILLSLTCCTLFAQSKRDVGYTFKALYTDTYVYRGHLYNPGDTILGELTIGKGQWSYTALMAESMDDFTTEDNQDIFGSEMVHNIAYTTATRGSVTTFGYMYYDYDDSIRPDTQEVYTRYAKQGAWNPTYGAAVDIDTYKGMYFDASISRAFPFSRHSSFLFTTLVGLSYNMKEETNDNNVVTEPAYFGDDGINHGTVTLKWIWQPRNWFKYEVGGDYHHAFDDFLEDSAPVEFDVAWSTSVTIFL